MSASADSYFIQFGGQGGAWYPELSRFYRDHVLNEQSSADPFLKKVISAGLDSLQKELKKNKDSVALLPYEADLHKWLSSDDAVPDEEYLERAPVSMPLIQLAQICNLIHLGSVNPRLSLSHLYDASLAATGHSQGLITAYLFALKLSEEKFIQAVADFTLFQFYMGLRSQEFYPFPSASAEEKKAADEINTGSTPSPMAAVLGPSEEQIAALAEKFNSGRSDLSRKVFISLYNTPANHILSGSRTALTQFFSENRDFLTAEGNNFVFLKATCPFHSPYLHNAVQLFEEDLKTLPFSYPADSVRLPVYSFSDGKNLQLSANPALQLTNDMLRNVLYWNKPYKSFIESESFGSKSITVLDFGPGRVSQRLTMDVFSDLRTAGEIPFGEVYSAAYVRDLRKLAEL